MTETLLAARSRNPVRGFRALELVNRSAEDAIRLLLDRASALGSSDLFLLSDERMVTVAVRRLGNVERMAVIASDLGRQIMAYVKACAGMDISEKRRPADGRWMLDLSNRRLDMRINFTPTLYGEDLTIRICDRARGQYDIDQLGLAPAEQNQLLAMLNRTSGLLVVTGPTGAGKTTTLYAFLRYLNNGLRKINTLEDPIEYSLEGVRQSQVNLRIGLDFPELLRHVLRQAADVIMIGEIRDSQTMTTAVRAANSGQLVLATLHSPTAAASIQTMLALEAHPHFLSSGLLGIISQRLVRTLCPHCREPGDPDDDIFPWEEIESSLEPGQPQVVYRPVGCDHCYQIGYAGRSGVFEILKVTPEIRRLIAQSANSREIEAAAVRAGMIGLRRAALLKVAQGVTGTEEVFRDVAAEYHEADQYL